tara:strand:+ start:4163 stop:5176 length:1014 start_codon:yes stop_codon:yes gene_type:complete
VNYSIILRVVIAFLSVAVVYLNKMRYDSFILQSELYYDQMLQRPFINKDFDFINSINDYYPSLNVFGMPLVSLKAQYFLSRDSIGKGIAYLEEGEKRNPYIGFSESVLGETYLKIGDINKANYYIRKAFDKVPNNPVHYILLVKLLKKENKNDSIFYYYNLIKDKVGEKDYQIYNIVLGSFIESKDTLDKYGANKIIEEALKYHPNNNLIKLMTDYALYGKENVDLAATNYKTAIENLNSGNYEDGIDELYKVIELHPNIQIYYNNLIIALYNKKKYQEISSLWEVYSETFKSIDQSIIYYFAYAFNQIGDIDKTCSAINILIRTNYTFDRSIFPKC